MPNFANYNEVKLYGITEARLNNTTIKHLEADSTFTLDAITRRTGKGVSEIIAYKARAVLYVPHNRIENYSTEIANISATLTQATLVIKSKAGDSQDVHFEVQMVASYLTSQGIAIGAALSRVDVESVAGPRFRFCIEIEAMFTKDIVTNTQAWDTLFSDMN